MMQSYMGAPSRHPDVAVVGSGIIGTAVAARLAQQDARIAWCAEAGPRHGATAASGAMLGVLGEVEPGADEAELSLRIAAAERHAVWRDELALNCAGFGTFLVASARRRRDQLAATAIETAATRHAMRCERVEPADVPGLRPSAQRWPARVLHLPDEAWVDVAALMSSIEERVCGMPQVDRIDDAVAALNHSGDRVTGFQTVSGRAVVAGETVLCVGADVPALIQRSGLARDLLPLVLPAKGIGLLLTPPPNAEPHRHVLRSPNREFACGVHIVPRTAGAVYVGATNRVSLHPDLLGASTAGEVSLLLDQVLHELAAPLARWNLSEMTWGFRPLPVDGQPIVGRTALPGLSVATGTYRNGVLLAPLLADVLADELDDAAGRFPNRFSPTRRAIAGSPSGLLREGLAETAAQLVDATDVEWADRLAPLLAVLGTAAFDEGADAERVRRHARELIARNPRTEMVPETLVELLQEDSGLEAEAKRPEGDGPSASS